MITPKQIFDTWRDNDLFGFELPNEGETYYEYRNRIGDESLASDRLFHFVLTELCTEELAPEEIDHRMNRAIGDLQLVQASLGDPLTFGGSHAPD